MDKKIAELDRLVRNLSSRIKELERDNNMLKSISQLSSTSTLSDVILTLNKVTSSIKRK